MKEIKAVIGKNFGDEGKGMMVNTLCLDCVIKGKSALVVRHNGGAQAGHTVEDKDFRFVFHQLGSGSRQRIPTYWSKTFLPDLLKLGEEAGEFEEAQLKSGIKQGLLSIYASEKCVCTTVYDILLNSFAEELRGKQKHGSCGMGIYETVLRSRRDEKREYTFSLGDLRGKGPKELAEILRKIRDGYCMCRIEELMREAGGFIEKQERKDRSLPKNNEWVQLIMDDNLLYNAAHIMWENFNRYIVIAEPKEVFPRFDTIIFEGAQGLLLDENNTAYYPHLTPSRTGLFNVMNLLEQTGIIERGEKEGNRREYKAAEVLMDVHYITRTYVTRHGAGRLDHECAKEEINPAMEDMTNVPNRWQDALRYAKHPGADEFFGSLREEGKILEDYPDISANIFIDITHLDETDGKIIFYDKSVEIGQFALQYEHKEGVRILPAL